MKVVCLDCTAPCQRGFQAKYLLRFQLSALNLELGRSWHGPFPSRPSAFGARTCAASTCCACGRFGESCYTLYRPTILYIYKSKKCIAWCLLSHPFPICFTCRMRHSRDPACACWRCESQLSQSAPQSRIPNPQGCGMRAPTHEWIKPSNCCTSYIHLEPN